jgi:hypothetical protein
MEQLNKLTSYFAGFAAKDLTQISENFSEDVFLADWVGSWSGKEEVKNAIQDIIKNDIFIVPEKFYFSYDGDGIVVTCFIDIYINNERLKVVDIVKMTDEGEIKSINAYKR